MVNRLESMGFERNNAASVLRSQNNDMERAIDILLAEQARQESRDVIMSENPR